MVRDRRVLLALFLQPWLAFDGGFQCNGMGRIVGDQFAQSIDLAIGHLQHASDIAAYRPRLQLSESDDLRDAVLSVLLLDIGDDFVAAVLAEVDVEVRHRHPFRIEKSLEQQVEPKRVEVGDGQCIGHERAGARPAARTDRNAVGLGELDEVGDDQEVAGKLHVDDDVEFELEARLVVLAAVARHGAVHRQPHPQTLTRLCLKLFRLVALGREARQDRFCRDRAKRASPCYFHRVFNRLGNVRKQPDHVARRLEIVLRRQPPPVFRGDDLSLRDAEERIMCSEIVGAGEIRFVRGHERDAKLVGELDEARLGADFGLQIVALQLDVQPVSEQLMQSFDPLPRKNRLPLRQRLVNRPRRAAGKTDEPVRMAFDQRQRHMRLGVIGRVEIGPARQLHEVRITRCVLGQKRQHGALMFGRLPVVLRQIVEIDFQGAADDRLDAFFRQRLRKFERPEKVSGVGDRQRRHGIEFCQLRQLFDRQRPFRQRIGRMDAQMDECCRRIAHGAGGYSEAAAHANRLSPQSTPTRPIPPLRES